MRFSGRRLRILYGHTASKPGVREARPAVCHREQALDARVRGIVDASVASEAALTPEGHGVRYDANGDVIGVTIINARRIIKRDGHVTITLPHAVQVEGRELAAALG
jgi:hypothetical protein